MATVADGVHYEKAGKSCGKAEKSTIAYGKEMKESDNYQLRESPNINTVATNVQTGSYA